MSLGELVRQTPETSPNGDVVLGNQADQKALKREQQTKILELAPITGADWLETTDAEAITQEQHQRLFEAELTSFSVDDILDVFWDWKDFQDVSDTTHRDRERLKREEAEVLLTLIHKEHAKGLVPSELFKAASDYTVVNPENPDTEPLPRRKLVDDQPAEPEVLIARYHTYKLARYVFRNYPKLAYGGVVLPFDDEEVVNIALGFELKTGESLGNPLSYLKKSRESLPVDGVENAIDDLDLHHFFYPDSRKKHLRLLEQVGKGKRPKKTSQTKVSKDPIEFFYDTAKRQVIVLGRLSVQECTENEGKKHLERLRQNNKLIIGKLAMQQYQLANDQDPTQIQCLSELITGRDPIERDGKHIWTNWTHDDSLNYGVFILSVVNTVNQHVLARLSKLRLGPSGRIIMDRSGKPISNFFDEIKPRSKARPGEFTGLTFDDISNHIKSVAIANGGMVNEIILRRHYQEMKKNGVIVPSPAIIASASGVTVNQAIRAAGYNLGTRRGIWVSEQEVIDSCIRFFDEKNRLPEPSDFRYRKERGTPYLCSKTTAVTRLGDMSVMKERITIALKQRDQARQEAA